MGNFIEQVNFETGEILEAPNENLIVRKGGLYSPLPIPAYKILGKTKQYNAQRVLTCLISHLGYRQKAVFPSYDQIAALSGVRRNDIKSALDDLIELGFIKVFQYWNNDRRFNKYYIQESCFKPHLMGEKGQSYEDCLGLCARCYKRVVVGDFFTVNNESRHYVCGGGILLNKRGKKHLKRIEKDAFGE